MKVIHDLNGIKKSVKNIEGHLSEKEIEFLYLAASYPSAEGEILEIGSFKGKSTVVLAQSALNCGNKKIVCVDPFTSPSCTDPDLGAQSSSFQEFIDNLRQAGVEENVEYHRDFSYNLVINWDKTIRLLWIDGDHTYKGVKSDFDNFNRYLSEGALVMFHDVLHRFDGPIRVFIEDVIYSDHFGLAGCCGSIGWAQYSTDIEINAQYMSTKKKLYNKLSKIIPFCVFKEELSGFGKYLYKYYRARIPHGTIHNPPWNIIT